MIKASVCTQIVIYFAILAIGYYGFGTAKELVPRNLLFLKPLSKLVIELSKYQYFKFLCDFGSTNFVCRSIPRNYSAGLGVALCSVSGDPLLLLGSLYQRHVLHSPKNAKKDQAEESTELHCRLCRLSRPNLSPRLQGRDVLHRRRVELLHRGDCSLLDRFQHRK